MPTKHNKKRYQTTDKPKQELIFTGRVMLEYHDDEALATPEKGDFKLFPSEEILRTARQGDYWSTGLAGYFRVDIYDGREWRAVQLVDLFPDREHHFSKKECPIDTYELCAELLRAKAGMKLVRTYREHYMPAAGEDSES